MRYLAILYVFALTGCLTPSNSEKVAKTSASNFEHENEIDMEKEDLDNLEITTTQRIKVQYTPQKLGQAIQRASNTLLQRFATPAEVQQARMGIDGYKTVINSYLNNPRIMKTMKKYNDNFFGVAGMMRENGVSDGVDYDEPTNMVLYLFKNDRDYREAVTANYCVDDSLNIVGCDAFPNPSTASDHAAGILTSRAFLSAFANHYNFARVNAMKRLFSCSAFPDTGDPGLSENEISTKVKEFNCTDCDPACIKCHSTINSRAAVFYNYSWKGRYVAETYNSTTNDSDEPSDVDDLMVPGTRSRYYGRDVTTVRDMGMILSNRDQFRNCMVQRFTNFLLGRKFDDVLPDAMKDLYDSPEANTYRIRNVLRAALTHPLYINK